MKSLQRVMKFDKSYLPIIMMLMAIFFSCDKETEVIGFDVAQTERLLRGDSTKTWVRTSRSEAGKSIILDECALDNTLIFSLSKVDTIPNPFLFQTSCGDTLLYGGWLAKNDFGGNRTDSLLYLINPDTIKTVDTLYINYDTLYNSIENITSQFLLISGVDSTSGSQILISEDFHVK